MKVIYSPNVKHDTIKRKLAIINHSHENTYGIFYYPDDDPTKIINISNYFKKEAQP